MPCPVALETESDEIEKETFERITAWFAHAFGFYRVNQSHILTLLFFDKNP
jgi:hypothetical protein